MTALMLAAALACWDSERIDWHSVTIEVDHGHEGASWSVANAKSWAATAAGYETALSKGERLSLTTGLACPDDTPVCLERCQGERCLREVLEEMPSVNERVVPIWIVQVFASSNEHAAARALLTASEFTSPGFYQVALHPGPTREGEVREAMVDGRRVFQAITAAYATRDAARSAAAVLRSHGLAAFVRGE